MFQRLLLQDGNHVLAKIIALIVYIETARVVSCEHGRPVEQAYSSQNFVEFFLYILS